MGNARRKREAFLEKHPLCCFCGGGNQSETIDHVPPRVMFTGRNWPEGFAFPACQSCNNRTRAIEQVIALYAYLGASEAESEANATFKKLVTGVRNNNPELLPDPHTSATEKKKFLRRIGAVLPTGATTDELLLARLPANLSEKFASFFAKLFCALFYRETNAIFPLGGAISIVFTTSEYANVGEFDNLFKIVTGQRATGRGNRDLSTEFSYRYETGEEGRVFAILVHMRGRMFIFAGGVIDRNFDLALGKPKWRDIFGKLVPLVESGPH